MERQFPSGSLTCTPQVVCHDVHGDLIRGGLADVRGLTSVLTILASRQQTLTRQTVKSF